MCALYLSSTAYYAVYFYAGDAHWFTFTKTNRGIIVADYYLGRFNTDYFYQ